MPVWLVTGATGFLGRHVLAALRDANPADVTVIASGRQHPPDLESYPFLEVDLRDDDSVKSVLSACVPDVVLHLAGRTPPADPEALERNNATATARLLDALRSLGKPSRVVLAGSAAELGPVPEDDLPVGEDYPCRPADAYGRSKLRATEAGLTARPPLEVVVGRIFNPIGPGMPTSQAFGRFAERLAATGPDPVRLVVGDLDARRDFIDVRDAARALIRLAVSGRAGQVYHIGTGQSRHVGDGLDELIRLSGRRVEMEIDSAMAAHRGPRDSRAAIGRIMEEVGWRPEIDWRQSLGDLWDEARSRPGLPLTGPLRPV